MIGLGLPVVIGRTGDFSITKKADPKISLFTERAMVLLDDYSLMIPLAIALVTASVRFVTSSF